jgi:beta-glucosidase
LFSYLAVALYISASNGSAAELKTAPLVVSGASASGAALTSEEQNVTARVESILKQLTFEEKVKLLSGTPDEMHIPGIERLNIPSLKFSDGPVGVRCWGKSTAYPCGSMLAASWDVDAANEVGHALGRDSRARGVHILLGPGVDLYRVAQCGRNFEYFGEDPYLASQIAVSWIKGLQEEGVAASVKHFAANDQETLRDSIDTIVSARRLQEICFPTFKAAVKEANVATVMAAYNKVNGDWCTASKPLSTDVLRKQWGFDGVLMSDWGAVHELLKPFVAGTDLEMGKTLFYTAEKIKQLVDAGQITQAQIDEHVKRVLLLIVRMGFLDHEQLVKSIPLDDPKSAAVALKIATEGLVLLRNQNNVLPLSRTTTKNIVVVGPNASPEIVRGGGSSETDPFKALSLIEALRATAGDTIKIDYIPTWIGSDPSADSSFNSKSFFEPNSKDGTRKAIADYFCNEELTGTPVVSKLDETINFKWNNGHPLEEIQTPKYSMRWTGKIKAPQTDDYIFCCRSDGARVKLDGKTIIDDWSSPAVATRTHKLHLERDRTYDLIVEYHHTHGPSAVQFSWAKADKDFTAEEKEMIAKADAVVASVGLNRHIECEGYDHAYDLPSEQVSLIDDLAKLNTQIIVVLNAGGNVGMKHWIDNTAALIHAWYPGQNGNKAVAGAIFGDINPSGKLPDTFEVQWEDSPAFGNYPGESKNGGRVNYAEGIYVGYRSFDKRKLAPRYPFGYGLSYTTFALENMEIRNDSQTPQVSVNVINTGKRRGATVVQLYVRPVNLRAGDDRPMQELKGFRRVELKPGERKSIVFALTADSFATYDESANAWKSPAGEYAIALGFSSRDIASEKSILWRSAVQSNRR